ncbi:MAG: replication initiation protein [Cetobacterium sp.]
MNFFNKNKFFLKKDENIEIIFNKNLSKKQKKLLNIIILEINALKIDKINIKTEALLKSLELEKVNELIIYIEKVCEFKIQTIDKECEEKLKYSSFKIFSSFVCTEKLCTFFIDSNFLNLYKNPVTDVYGIQNIIRFYNEKSFYMYIFLEKNLREKDEFIVSIDEFKELLKIENKYERYFDIKVKVITPALKDINNSLGDKYKAMEIRKHISSKSPVVGIKFIKENKNKSFEKNFLDRLEKYMSKKDYLKNRHIFFEFIEKNHEETIIKSIDLVESLGSKDFLKTFLYVLEEELYLKGISNKSINSILYLEREFKNINEITSLIINKLLELEYYDYYDQKLTKKIAYFKSTNILFYENKNFKIFARYSLNKTALINIESI